MERPFHIYQSSAGSGKTYTLAFSYLQIALDNPEDYKSILGVTFTNKATEEMKGRIITILNDLVSEKDHPMRQDLERTLKLKPHELNRRAQILLTNILHQYGRFSILTIDSFFHQVIRSFAREMGLQGTFSIDLDTDKILQEVIDNLLSKIGDNDKKDIRSWLMQFADEKVEEGKSWDFRSDILELAREILKDRFKSRASEIFNVEESHLFFNQLLNELKKEKENFENTCETIASKGALVLEQAGGVDMFSRKASGPAGLFKKVLSGDYTITDTRRAAATDVSKWLTKQALNDGPLVHACEKEIMPVYQKLIQHVDQHYPGYVSISEVYRYFYTYGILSAINEELQQYRLENDVMLIADLPDFLRQVIDDGETPFIYEKVGSLFQYYLIDEFQDTSLFQWNNFKPLIQNTVAGGGTSLVVGDTKQSIYRWRGGDWRLLSSGLQKEVGEYFVQEHNLDSNWRSDGEIVNFNNWLFSNLSEVSIDYFSDLDEGLLPELEELQNVYESSIQQIQKNEGAGFVSFNFLETEDWKSAAIEGTIARVEQLQREGYALRDMAILTRTQYEGKLIANAFMDHKQSSKAQPSLKYDVVSSEALYLYSSHVVRFIISMIKWLNNEQNKIVLAEWVHEYLTFLKEEGNESGFGAVVDWRLIVPQPFVRQKDYLKTLPLFELVETLIRLFSLNKVTSEITYLQGFQDAVLDYSKNEGGDIPSFLAWWEDIRKERAIQIADENDAVKILTIHKAKGLEFPIVIVPFLSWKLDHDIFGGNEILWVEPKGDDVFQKASVLPLKYSQKLKETYWKEEYWREKLSAYLDSVNLLYVAMTRPKNALFVFGGVPKTDRLATVGDLCFQLIQQHPNWDVKNNGFSTGKISPNSTVPEKGAEFALDKYPSETWRGKVSVQMKGAIELSEREFSSQKKGIDIHTALSEIDRMEDLEKGHHLIDLISQIDVRPFFEQIEEVKKEVPILLPGGDFYRIDRMVRKGDTWYVIDFKTGEQMKKDENQVKNYLKILGEMGYEKLKGVLIYVEPVVVKEVA